VLHSGIFLDLVMVVHVHEEAAKHEGNGAEEKDEEIEEYVPVKKRRLMATAIQKSEGEGRYWN
jgi:hypothetical protein